MCVLNLCDLSLEICQRVSFLFMYKKRRSFGKFRITRYYVYIYFKPIFKSVIRHINDFTIIQFIGRYLLSFPRFSFFLILIFRWSISVDLITFFGNDFHILFLPGFFHHRIVFLRKDLCHVIPADECYHQCNSKNHRNVEQVGYYTDRIGVFFFRNRLCFISL